MSYRNVILYEGKRAKGEIGSKLFTVWIPLGGKKHYNSACSSKFFTNISEVLNFTIYKVWIIKIVGNIAF